MAIEKAFAIEAEPGPIWDALWGELRLGSEGEFTVKQSNRPRLLVLALDLGGLPVQLSYEIEARAGYSEVAARLEPLSWRYRLFQLVTFGHLRRNYEILLVAGLVNLKRSLEGEAGPGADAPVAGP
jgi:hypothetical protein